MIEEYYKEEAVTVYCASCLDVLPQLSGVTACVTDPPYGLSFMGKEWDHGVPGEAFWRAIAGACLPGAMMLAFGGTRTYHRMTCAIEDAGWEIRDCLMWLYGSGFPKSLDISKAIDKAAGAERELVERLRPDGKGTGQTCSGFVGGSQSPQLKRDDTPATDAAKLWNGYGTALKPAYEPIVLAMNALSGTFAANALEHGVAGVNVDGCRVGTDDDTGRKTGSLFSGMPKPGGIIGGETTSHPQGRWPANILHDGSDEVLAGFPVTKGDSKNRKPRTNKGEGNNCFGDYGKATYDIERTDSGSAARFFKCCPQDEPRRAFYCAKASRAERNEGCEGLPDGILARSCQAIAEAKRGNTVDEEGGAFNKARVVKNDHATVKPLALMRYLLTLVTMPERNLILDAFAGSGTTGVACKELGLPCILIEQDAHHCDIIAARCAAARRDEQPKADRQLDLLF